MAAEFVTRQEVTRLTGVPKNRLLRWIERGLLPPLSMRTAPGGRGQQGVWPAAVINRIRRILALQSEAHSLDVIATTLAQETVQSNIERVRELRSTAERQVQVDDQAMTLRDYFVAIVATRVTQDVHSDVIRELRDRGNVLEHALKSHEDGSPLVLVVRYGEIELVQAWRVSELFCQPETFPIERGPAQLIPLYGCLVQLHNETAMPLPEARRNVYPSNTLKVLENGAVRLVRYEWVYGQVSRWTPESVRFIDAVPADQKLSSRRRTRPDESRKGRRSVPPRGTSKPGASK
jgi:DNA-binding transcriptional MerR regulator